MRPVYQSRTGEDGRCMSACVASILELPEAAVPDFLDGDQAKLVNQFTHKHGLHYRRVPLSQPPDGWHTVEGVSPRGGMHAIIGRDGRQAFDPHRPDGTGNGIVEPMYYGEFMPLDKYRAGLHRALDAALDAAPETIETYRGYAIQRGESGAISVVGLGRRYAQYFNGWTEQAAVKKAKAAIDKELTKPPAGPVNPDDLIRSITK
jgi:hypothetical protein